MVGYAAVQIALSRGLTVMATAGSTFAKDLEGFGARVTSYGDGMVGRVREITGGKDVDAVFDAARPGPGAMAGLIELAGGDPRRVVTIGNHDEARSLGARVNIDELATVDRAPLGELLPHYAALAAQGRFRLPIAGTFAFDRWREAVELSVSGNPHGKIVLVPAAS